MSVTHVHDVCSSCILRVVAFEGGSWRTGWLEGVDVHIRIDRGGGRWRWCSAPASCFGRPAALAHGHA